MSGSYQSRLSCLHLNMRVVEVVAAALISTHMLDAVLDGNSAVSEVRLGHAAVAQDSFPDTLQPVGASRGVLPLFQGRQAYETKQATINRQQKTFAHTNTTHEPKITFHIVDSLSHHTAFTKACIVKTRYIFQCAFV